MKGGEITFNFKGDTDDLDKKTNSISSKLGSMGSAIGSAFVKGSAVVGTALVGMVGASVKSYADIEQSIGGVETLFKDSANAVIENSKKAYQTAGIDANTYMEQVTSFSASLLQSLGGDTKKSAEIADQAIIDMADNSNKMGTSLESIQTAYQGFAKGQYMLLDNLKLGYGGTKTEMERLLKDASKLSGQKYNIDNLSDVYQAIHVIQEDLGITGTTGKEAMSTISGSVQTAKASFQNFLSGQGSIDDVISTFVTAGTNITNAIVKMAPQIVQGIVALVNGIIPQIPTLIKTLLPVVLKGVIDIANGIIQALPTLIQMLSQMLPEILQALIQGLVQITQSLADQMPVLIPQIINAILDMIPVLIDNLPLFIKAGWQLLTGIALGLLNAVPGLLSRIPGIVSSILNYFKQMPRMMREVGGNLIKGLWQGISNLGKWCIDKIKGLGSSILKSVKNIFGVHSPSTEFSAIGRFNMIGLINGTEEMKDKVYDAYEGILDMGNFDSMFDLSPSLYGTASTNLSPNVNVVVNNNMKQDPLGQIVNDIKTFSGGSKNDYNYVGA